MAVNTKAIKRRIRSVGNTKKITKAMEMVSASKMRKAVTAALNTRTYAKMAWDLLVHLSELEKEALPLLEVREVKKLLLILVTSNRGLCGSFNSNIIRKTAEQLRDPRNISRQRMKNRIVEPSDAVSVDVIGVGKKGAEFAKKMGYNLIAAFTDFPDTPGLDDINPISRMVVKEYEAKKYDKVVVAYTDYRSAIAQVAKLRQVLPISETDLEKMLDEIKSLNGDNVMPEVELEDYLFEPNQNEVLKIESSFQSQQKDKKLKQTPRFL